MPAGFFSRWWTPACAWMRCRTVGLGPAQGPCITHAQRHFFSGRKTVLNFSNEISSNKKKRKYRRRWREEGRPPPTADGSLSAPLHPTASSAHWTFSPCSHLSAHATVRQGACVTAPGASGRFPPACVVTSPCLCSRGSPLFGVNCVPLKRYAHVLTPSTCGWDCVWK